MISQDKAAFLLQLIHSSQESLLELEQSFRLGDKERVERLKKELLSLSAQIKATLAKK